MIIEPPKNLAEFEAVKTTLERLLNNPHLDPKSKVKVRKRIEDTNKEIEALQHTKNS